MWKQWELEAFLELQSKMFNIRIWLVFLPYLLLLLAPINLDLCQASSLEDPGLSVLEESIFVGLRISAIENLQSEPASILRGVQIICLDTQISFILLLAHISGAKTEKIEKWTPTLNKKVDFSLWVWNRLFLRTVEM